MGKKGLGRKAFVKAAMAGPSGPQPDEEAEVEAAAPAPAPPAEAPEGAANGEAATSTSTPVKHAAEDTVATPAVADTPEAPEDETRGQLVQRQKRELKAHKEAVKRLGKKRKDEAAKLEADLEERHARELTALEARGDETDECKPASVLAASLSACRVGADNGKAAARPTRAQKRRGARAAEEAEREARIAEEQASLGESDRAAEARALQALLDPLSLAVRDIPADGNCLYRAVEDQLRQCGADDEAPGSHAELRARVAAHMRAHAAEYAPFIVPETDDGEEAASADELFEEYCRTVEETAAWGGQVELGALAKLLDRSITVYSVGMPAVRMGPDEPGDKGMLRLCYLRHAFGLGEHYNSVEPKSDAVGEACGG